MKTSVIDSSPVLFHRRPQTQTAIVTRIIILSTFSRHIPRPHLQIPGKHNKKMDNIKQLITRNSHHKHKKILNSQIQNHFTFSRWMAAAVWLDTSPATLNTDENNWKRCDLTWSCLVSIPRDIMALPFRLYSLSLIYRGGLVCLISHVNVTILQTCEVPIPRLMSMFDDTSHCQKIGVIFAQKLSGS